MQKYHVWIVYYFHTNPIFMTPEAKQLLKDKPELCKDVVIAFRDSQGYANPHDEHFDESWEYFTGLHTAKDWEILSFKGVQFGPVYKLQPDGKYKDVLSFPYRKMIEEVENRTMIIHSVRRISDNEVFTVGDMIQNTVSSGKIISFQIVYDTMLARIEFNGGSYSSGINNVTKLKPFLITHDGKEIYRGETYYYVTDETYRVCDTIAYGSGDLRKDLVYFSTREAAEQWVEDHKPRYSIADLKARGLHI